MKFLVITGSLYNNHGGPFLSVRSLVYALLERGHEVTVIGSKDNNQQDITPEAYRFMLEKFPKLKVFALDKYGGYHLHFTPALSRYLDKNQKYDVSLIQGIWMWNCWRVFWFSWRNKITSIFSIRGEFNDAMSMKKLKKRLFKPFLKWMLNHASLVHVLNSKEAKRVQQYGIHTKICQIPNGVFLSPGIAEKANKKVVLFLGRLDPIKNILNLIKAWNNISADGWTLEIAGGGDDEYVAAIKNSIDNNPSIQLLGPVNEQQKPDIFKRATWFILPSLSEGMPMAALEAMSYGIPCILSEHCNLDDFFQYDAALKTGCNTEDLEKALEESLNCSPARRLELSSKALQLLKKSYSWNLVVDKFEQEIGLQKQIK